MGVFLAAVSGVVVLGVAGFLAGRVAASSENEIERIVDELTILEEQ